LGHLADVEGPLCAMSGRSWSSSTANLAACGPLSTDAQDRTMLSYRLTGYRSRCRSFDNGVPTASEPTINGLTALLCMGIHTLAMLTVSTAVGVCVYEWIGLEILRHAWLNVDLIWTLALLMAGGLLLLGQTQSPIPSMWSPIHRGTVPSATSHQWRLFGAPTGN